jgi:hypothetical protein
MCTTSIHLSIEKLINSTRKRVQQELLKYQVVSAMEPSQARQGQKIMSQQIQTPAMSFVPALPAFMPQQGHVGQVQGHPLHAQTQGQTDDPLQKVLSEYREKYLQGMEERIWLYQELVQKGEVLRQKEALIQEAVAHARLLESQIADKQARLIKDEEADDPSLHQFAAPPAPKRHKHHSTSTMPRQHHPLQHQKTPKIPLLHKKTSHQSNGSSNVNRQSHKNEASAAKLKSKLNKTRYEPANISFDELEASTPLTPPRPQGSSLQSSSKDSARAQLGYKKTPLAKKPVKKSSSVKKKTTSATPKKPTPKVEPKPPSMGFRLFIVKIYLTLPSLQNRRNSTCKY